VFVSELLKESNRAPSGIVVVAGPGSYTGLRIGVSTAKGLAWSLEVPIYAISSLHYVAQQLMADLSVLKSRSNLPISIFPVLHARKGELFAAEFSFQEGKLNRVAEDQAWSTSDLKQHISSSAGEHVVVAPINSKPDEIDLLKSDVLRIEPSLLNLGPVLENQLDAYRVQDLHSFEPSYLKEFVARKATMSVFEKLLF